MTWNICAWKISSSQYHAYIVQNIDLRKNVRVLQHYRDPMLQVLSTFSQYWLARCQEAVSINAATTAGREILSIRVSWLWNKSYRERHVHNSVTGPATPHQQEVPISACVAQSKVFSTDDIWVLICYSSTDRVASRMRNHAVVSTLEMSVSVTRSALELWQMHIQRPFFGMHNPIVSAIKCDVLNSQLKPSHFSKENLRMSAYVTRFCHYLLLRS